jgi:hypothetical protein
MIIGETKAENSNSWPWPLAGDKGEGTVRGSGGWMLMPLLRSASDA